MTDFTGFLTPEDDFKLEFERYFEQFVEHVQSDTLDTDNDFKALTMDMMERGEKLGLDLQQMVLDAAKDAGLR